MTARRIGVLTTTRADLAPLQSVVDELVRRPDTIPVVIAAGDRVVEQFGGRDHVIEHVAPARVVFVDADLGELTATGMTDAIGPMASGVQRVLDAERIDVMLVLGDRWEIIGPCLATVLSNIPIAHLHGGEVSGGAIDERIRHAVTKLSDVHLCATDDAARRIRQLGEPADSIFVTGAPGLDVFTSVEPLSVDVVQQITGKPVVRPWSLFTFHPATSASSDQTEVCRRALEAATTRGTVLASYPGAESGSDEIVELLDRLAADSDRLSVRSSYGGHYPALMATADVMVGNSSSGIIEAGSFGLPVVNIGSRQAGRLRGPNVIDADEDSESIRRALDRALDPTFRQSLNRRRNPYGDGHAAERIGERLASMPDRQAAKRFVDR